ncbi:hypothetical protein NE857_09170 [Nocardiopsis exhalans]|uniref:Head-to-tail stopper n=1 Tax=Nocardiopsis exhalans TaxID=163604 RepID=A0ABY5DBP1_9ACTN|nr:hypothetical protein [Nocardiopsis exhalans]USY21752.1 hypothetical protein NE857_09170 [Nocardiopsis exhalans]
MTVLGGHTVTVVGEAERDRHGDPIGDAPSIPVTGCHVEYLAVQETVETPEGTVTVSARAFLPPGTRIGEGGSVSFRGDDYHVVGRPLHRSTIHGEPHHIEVRLRDVQGV